MRGRGLVAGGAHQTEAPDEMPHMRPSFCASIRAVAIASSSETWITSSIIDRSAMQKKSTCEEKATGE